MSADVENMAFIGETPWHGEGTRLTGHESTKEMAEKSGLDWLVKTEPLFREDGTTVKAQVSIRESDGSELGVVGPQWTPLQNWDAFKVFEPLVESGDMSWHTAGSLQGGKRVWVLCQLNMDNAEIVPGDEIAKFALLSNGHDGKLAVHFGFTPIRVVCSNTEALARESKASRLIRVRHHANVKENVEKLRNIMNLASQEFETTCDQYRFLASESINTDDLAKYVKIVFNQGGKSDSEISTRQKNIMEQVTKLFESGKGQEIEKVKGTYWAAYNAITEHLNYNQGRNTSSRLNSLWYGQGNVQSRHALATAIAMAEMNR